MRIHKHIDKHNVYNIRNNLILLQDPRFRKSSLTIQAVNAISIFGNDKKGICSRRGECRLPTGHIYFYLVIAGQYN